MDSIAPAPAHAATGLTFTLFNALQRCFHRCGKTFFATKQRTTYVAMRHWISTCSRCQPQQSRKEISRRVCQRLTQPIRVQKAGHSDLCSSLAFKPCIVFRVTCSPCNVLNLDTTTVLSPHLTGSITPFEKLLKQTGKGRQNTDSHDRTTGPSSGQNRT